MNRLMLGAATLMTLTTFVHLLAGGPEVRQVVAASDLDPVVRSVSNVVWHGVSIVLALMALAMFWLTRHENRALAVMIGTIQLGFAVLFLGFGQFDLGSIFIMPQWTVFLICPMLMWFGRAHD